MNAILYARFSPRRNADKSESVETQLELCRAYCQERGIAIRGEYSDKALSGADEDRPGLWQAVDALKTGDVLIVYRLDRLARSVYLSYIIEQSVEKKRASIVSICGEGTEKDTPENELTRVILQALAQYERKAIAARTKAAMLRHQANGRRMSARPPFGYRTDPADPARLIEDLDERRVINQIFAMWAEGRTVRQIADALTTDGEPARGKRWHRCTIHRILRRGVPA